MNNESGHSLVAVIVSLVLTSLLLTGVNKNLIIAIKSIKFIKEKERPNNSEINDCGKISKEALTWQCQSLNDKKHLILYEN